MKLTHTKDYLLWINEEAEIKAEEWYLDVVSGEVVQCYDDAEAEALNRQLRKDFPKVTAYYPLNSEAKELDLPLLPNPFEEIPLMEKAVKLRKERGYHDEHHYSFCGGFIEGYKAEQSKGIFTLEDMEKAIEMTRNIYSDSSITEDYMSNEEIIQQIQQSKLPKEFIPEYGEQLKENGIEELIKTEFYQKFPEELPNCVFEKNIKTIINSQGKQELVGEYKY